MDHHKSLLIECKLEKYTMYVIYIMRIKLTRAHAYAHTRAHTHSLHVPILKMCKPYFMCMCMYVYMQVFMWWADKQQKFMGYILANTFAL